MLLTTEALCNILLIKTSSKLSTHTECIMRMSLTMMSR